MDIFRINKPPLTEDDPPAYSADFDAQVRDYDAATWVERYNRPGEVTIIGNPAPLQAAAPIGSWLSHALTNSIMVVEDHVIEKGKLAVTGRTIDEFIMDRRSVKNKDAEWSSEISSDSMIANLGYATSWDAVIELMREALNTNPFSSENIPSLWIMSDIRTGVTGEDHTSNVTPKKLATLSEAVYDILRSNDTGLKVERPSVMRKPYGEYVDGPGLVYATDEDLVFAIHVGQDITQNYDLRFNWGQGDLIDPRYLWSIRDQREGVYAYTRDHTRVLHGAKTGWDCAMGTLNCEDYDSNVPSYDSDVDDVLYGRMNRYVDKTNEGYLLTDAKIASTANPKFGTDYNIGDLVTVVGEYGVVQTMRVVEYATIEDKSGEQSIPTVANPFSSVHFGGSG